MIDHTESTGVKTALVVETVELFPSCKRKSQRCWANHITLLSGDVTKPALKLPGCERGSQGEAPPGY